MQPSQQIEKLHEALQLLNRGNATTDEVEKLFGLTLKAVEAVKTQLNKLIDDNRGEATDSHQRLKTALGSIETRITTLGSTLAETKQKLTGEMDAMVVEIFKEIRSVASQIPTVPSLKPLEDKLAQLEASIPAIPEPLTAQEVRDRLETLEGEERLDASAIKNLPEMVKTQAKAFGVGPVGVKGITSVNFQIADDTTYAGYKSISIPIQPTAPENPVEGMLWIDSN